MKIMHHLVRTLALSAVLGGLLVSAQAQVGSGWNDGNRWYPSVEIEEVYSGSNVDGNRYIITNGSRKDIERRAERKYQNLSDGRSQMEGYMKIVSMGGDRISVAQCFKYKSGPCSMLAYRKPDILYQVLGGEQLGKVKIGDEIRVNTLINADTGKCEIYLKGSWVNSKSKGSGTYRHKIGAYCTDSGYGPVTVEWNRVRFWKR
jgi:hypothetical protein